MLRARGSEEELIIHDSSESELAGCQQRGATRVCQAWMLDVNTLQCWQLALAMGKLQKILNVLSSAANAALKHMLDLRRV
ncbi:hypothetical protein PBY51_000116 [Eleginops maclovinus]|uniref:Uncharacterized protein n=1 Tax=Eleginops maclovinus TaxID=56733 RepID=A0AAN7XGV7_ELEMC|nr:hypothetical protein PBY51_000116 [Eleginops maclovinus]